MAVNSPGLPGWVSLNAQRLQVCRLRDEIQARQPMLRDKRSQLLALDVAYTSGLLSGLFLDHPPQACDAEANLQRHDEAIHETRLAEEPLERLVNNYPAAGMDLSDEEYRLYASALEHGDIYGFREVLKRDATHPGPSSWWLELEDKKASQRSDVFIVGDPPGEHTELEPEKPEIGQNKSPRQSRRSRGQRMNNAYWNWREHNSDLGLLDRDILVSGKDGGLTVPGIARLDWSFGTPFCISEKYLKQQGRGPDIDANITDVERHSFSENQLDIAGIIRNFPFRVRGTSRVFFQDFIVSKALDDVVDMVIGWQFMLEEFKLLFDNVREKVAGVFGEVVSNFSSKIAKVFSALRNRASELISRSPSPSPPYSLCDVFEPDFTVRPKYS